MKAINVRRCLIRSTGCSLIVIGGFGGLVHCLPSDLVGSAIAANGPIQRSTGGKTKVDVVKPRAGGIDRTITLPGSVYAFEYADLESKVSGYLQKLYVDIGDRVTQGQLLIELDVPELRSDVSRGKAAVERARAQEGQMKARIIAYQADLRTAENGVTRAEAGVKRDQAALEFREKQSRRFRELADAKSIDERLVDEKEEQRLAALAAVDAAQASLLEAQSRVASAAAKVEQAKADLVEAQAEIQVADANLERATVLAGYTSITSPYTGVVSFRGYHRGDFIRAADQGSTKPLLTVERTDLVRLVVNVPDSEVPYTNAGDETVTEFDALPGLKFTGKIARIAFSEDMKNKTMRTEIDLPNEKGLLHNGMYGKTKLMLETGDPRAFTIPSSALTGPTRDGKGTVFVVRDGVAQKTPVTVSADNGVYAEIVAGLSGKDPVIAGNNNAVTDGGAVETHEVSLTDQTKR